MPRAMARVMMAGLVQKMSSPTSSVTPPSRVHRELRGDGRVALDHAGAVQKVAGDAVEAVRLAELRRRRVQGDGHPVRAALVASVGDGLDQQPEHLFWFG